MDGVAVYQWGTGALAVAGSAFVSIRGVRRRGWRGLWWLLTAPVFVVAWYALEFGALVYGCVRLSGAGC